MFRSLAALGCLFGLCSAATADIVAKNVEYKHGATTLEGVLIYDNASTAKRPGVMVALEQGAASALARTRAAQFAKLGYAAFTVDLFGKGLQPKDAKEAAEKIGKERKLLRERATVALDAFTKQPIVDSKRVAGVGYGLGGTAMLELTRSGADLEGVVVAHGDLTATGDEAKKIGASILVLVGSDDPQIPLAQIGAFEDEMRKGGVDWQIVRYGGAVHDFTNPQAGRNLKSGSAYDANADGRAADAIKYFLAETFPPVVPKVAPKAVPPMPKGFPDKVLKVLKFVDENGEAMDNYEGGRTFGNFEKRLPQTDEKGRRIKYREWDVNPLRPGVNRGAERLVTGSDGSAYYTEDHYATFKKIR